MQRSNNGSRKLLLIALLLLLMVVPVLSASNPVRLKDIARILEARDNQLYGFGLVIGLKNSGDSTQTEYTKIALTNLLSRVGIAPQDKEFKSRNVASVMVTASLPPFVNNGQKIDVTVSSLGDATSLQGGTLLLTPLQGPDENVYAVAQGQVSLGFPGTNTTLAEKRQTTVGRISNGAIVEKEVPVSIEKNYITIVLSNPDYTTSSRLAKALNSAGIIAKAIDAGTITASKDAYTEMVDFIAKIENVSVIPDVSAKVVINEQTGVIVMGENTQISPIAISFGDINVSITSSASTQELSAGTKLSKLVSALNSVGVKPKDLIAILQSIKRAGAISADIEVM